MAKFRKKPVVIEAEQWHQAGDQADVRVFLGPMPGPCGHCGNYQDKHGAIETLEGQHIVCPGDWIITGVKGERYPCKPDVFEETYAAVEEATA